MLLPYCRLQRAISRVDGIIRYVYEVDAGKPEGSDTTLTVRGAAVVVPVCLHCLLMVPELLLLV